MSYDQYVKWLEETEQINKDKQEKGLWFQDCSPFFIGGWGSQCYGGQQSWIINREE